MDNQQPPESASALRHMLHLIARDLGIDDQDGTVNAVTTTRAIRGRIHDMITTVVNANKAAQRLLDTLKEDDNG